MHTCRHEDEPSDDRPGSAGARLVERAARQHDADFEARLAKIHKDLERLQINASVLDQDEQQTVARLVGKKLSLSAALKEDERYNGMSNEQFLEDLRFSAEEEGQDAAWRRAQLARLQAHQRERLGGAAGAAGEIEPADFEDPAHGSYRHSPHTYHLNDEEFLTMDSTQGSRNDADVAGDTDAQYVCPSRLPLFWATDAAYALRRLPCGSCLTHVLAVVICCRLNFLNRRTLWLLVASCAMLTCSSPTGQLPHTQTMIFSS